MPNTHWIVKELFNIAKSKGLHKREWRGLSEKIQDVAGVRIAPGTLRCWANAKYIPRISDVEYMASALGYELDLHLGLTPEPNKS